MKQMLRLRWLLLVPTAVLVIAVARAGSNERKAAACPDSEPSVLVDTKLHELALCQHGIADARFSVRLGRHGVGKTREGDGKTPLGTYALSRPRSSPSFGVFIPIGYPTSEQAAHGYTGSAVGIHGPHRAVRWLGSLVNVLDSTDGCVGVASDREMSTIADWLEAHPQAMVFIR